MPRAASCGARAAGAARARRQGAGRLERADDRRARPCRRWRSSGRTGSRSRDDAFAFVARARWRRRRPAVAIAGATAARGIRRASTTTPISAAPRWRCTRRPATPAISRRRGTGSRCSTAITGTPTAAAISSPPTTPTDLIARAKTATDAAVPSGNGTMVGVLARLVYPDRRRGLSRPRRGDHRAPSPARSSATSFRSRRCSTTPSLRRTPVQIVLVGEPDDPASPRCAGRSTRYRCRTACVQRGRARTGALPAGHPAPGKGLVDGKAAAYVCEGPVCSLPIVRVASDWLTRLAATALMFVTVPHGCAMPSLIDPEPGRRADHRRGRTAPSSRSRWADGARQATAARCWPRRRGSSTPISPANAPISTCRCAPAGSPFERRVWDGDAANPLRQDADPMASSPPAIGSAPRAVGGACGTQPDPDRHPLPPRAGQGGHRRLQRRAG